MIKLIKRYKTFLSTIIFAYLYMVMILIVPSGYQAIIPGGLNHATESYVFIDEDGDEIALNQQFNTIYVTSYYDVSVFQKWIIESSKTIDIYPKTEQDDTLTSRERRKQGEISMLSSIDASLIAAFEMSILYQNQFDHTQSLDIQIQYNFLGLVVYYAFGKLEIGDIIIAINGEDASSYDYSTYYRLLYENGTQKKTFKAKINRDGQLLDIDVSFEENEYISFYPKFSNIVTKPVLKEIRYDGTVGGPSGGFIQTLSLYVSLLKLNIGKTKIAGTGTIELIKNDRGSYQIGRIGGLVQKGYTAINHKVDLFITSAYYKLADTKESIEFRALSSHLNIEYFVDLQEAIEYINEKNRA